MQRVLDGLNKEKTNLINPSTVIVVAGIAKVFVGELVEEARMVLEEWGDGPDSAIMPAHIVEAHRRLKGRGIIPTSTNYQRKNPFF